MLTDKTFKNIIVFTSIGILGILAFLIIRPLLLAILGGLVLAYIFFPLHKQVFKIFREKNISSLIIILFVIFLFFIPLWFFLPVIVRQIFNTYLYLQNMDISSVIKNIFPGISDQFLADFISIFKNFMSNITTSLFPSFSKILLELPYILLQTLVVFFVFFFSMRDADKLGEYVKSISPFAKDVEKGLVEQFKGITASVIFGQLIVGIVQGIVAGIGFYIFQVPNALLLTLLAVFLAVIPMIGTAFVWVPASIYLIISGNNFAGIGLFLYGALIVSWVDNLIRPFIVSKRTKMPAYLVLIGMIGGLIVFGVIGLILGPLILSYLLILFEAYRNKKFSSLFSQ